MKRAPLPGQGALIDLLPTGEPVLAAGLATGQPELAPQNISLPRQIEPEDAADRLVNTGVFNYTTAAHRLEEGSVAVTGAASATRPQPRGGVAPRQRRPSGLGAQLGEESSVGLDEPWGSERRVPLSAAQIALNTRRRAEINKQFGWKQRDEK